MVQFSCPACDQTYNLADEKVLGRTIRVRCRTCAAVVVVAWPPGTEAAAVGLDAAAPPPAAASAVAPAVPGADVPARARAPDPATADPGDGAGEPVRHMAETPEPTIAELEAERAEEEPRGGWSPLSRHRLARAYARRGTAHHEAGDPGAAEPDYDRAIELWGPIEAARGLVAEVLVNRAAMRSGRGVPAAAIEDAGRAIDLVEGLRAKVESEPSTGRLHPYLREVLLRAHLARVQARSELGEPVLDDLGRAVEVGESGLGPDAGTGLRAALATAYQRRGFARPSSDHAAAAADHARSVALLEELQGSEDWTSELQCLLAAAHAGRGLALGDVDPVASASDLGRAITLREALRGKPGWTPALAHAHSGAYLGRADALHAAGDTPAALADYAQAIALREELRRELEPSGRWPRAWALSYAEAYARRAYALGDRDQHREAAADYARAIEARERAGPTSDADAVVLLNLHHDRVLMLRAAGDMPAASAACARLVEVGEARRAALEPAGRFTEADREELAKAHLDSGLVRVSLGERARAEEDFTRAIELRTAVRAALEPQGRWTRQLQRTLALAHQLRGEVRIARQSELTGVQDYEAADTLLRTLAGADELYLADYCLNAHNLILARGSKFMMGVASPFFSLTFFSTMTFVLALVERLGGAGAISARARAELDDLLRLTVQVPMNPTLQKAVEAQRRALAEHRQRDQSG